MHDIYDRLARLGFTATFVRGCILPDWWEDKLADVPANRQYAEAVIARQLGIEMSSLRDKSAHLKMRRSGSLKLKRRAGTTDEEMKAALILGESLARVAANTLDTPPDLSDLTAASIRRKILGPGAQWVGCDELLDFCWGIGIPVVRLCKLPAGNKKPDGMACWPEKRPVIIIASGRRQPAWHVFYVAHELGHIALAHLSKGEVTIDPKVELDSTERHEAEANAFAVELLSGHPDLSFKPGTRTMNARQLAESAISIGRELRIDPGFLILSYSRSKGYYALAGAALNALQPEADVCSLYQTPYQRLKIDDTTEDNRHVFECLTEAA
jgi:hypothetical protein